MKVKLFFGFLCVTVLLLVYNSLLVGWPALGIQGAVLLVFGDILIGLAVAWVFSRLFIRDIAALVESSTIISRGDLSRRVKVSSQGDEVAQLADAFNAMVDSLTHVLQKTQVTANDLHQASRRLSGTSTEVNASVEEISASARRMAVGADRQASMATSALALTRDLASLVQRISGRTGEVAESASHAGAALEELRAHTATVNDAFATVSHHIRETSTAIDGFRHKATHIQRAVQRISEIAHETHILALNASIEAARAGDDARGFSAVAEEVRLLAESVRDFASGIDGMTDEIQASANSVQVAIQTTARAAERGQDRVAQTKAETESITSSFQSIVARVREISEATQRQTEEAADAVKALEEIAKLARANAQTTEETSAAAGEQSGAMDELARSAHDLLGAADRLRDLVSVFVLPGEASTTVPLAGPRPGLTPNAGRVPTARDA